MVDLLLYSILGLDVVFETLESYIYGHAPQLRCQISLVWDFPHNGEHTWEVLSAGLVWEMIGRIWSDIGVEWDGPDQNLN